MLDDKKMLMVARKVVVSNWFNLQLLHVRVIRGVINVQGHIQRLRGDEDAREGDESTLRRLDAELQAISSCRGVTYGLDNWAHETSGGWRRIPGEKAKPTLTLRPGESQEDATPKTASE